MINLIIANSLGVISGSLTIGSTFMHTKRKILLCQILCCFCDAAVELLVWSIPGLIANFLAFTRNFVCLNKNLYKRVWWIFVVVMTFCGVWFNTVGFAGYVSIIGIVQYTIWILFAETPQHMRWGILVNILIWLVYEVLLSLWIYVVVLVVELVMTCVNLYRYRGGVE